MNDKIQAILTQLKSSFEQLYGDRLVQMVLFGSQARGDAKLGSDIDILVILQGDVQPCQEINRTLDMVADMSLKNDEVINCIFMENNEFKSWNSPLLMNVRKEGILL